MRALRVAAILLCSVVGVAPGSLARTGEQSEREYQGGYGGPFQVHPGLDGEAPEGDATG